MNLEDQTRWLEEQRYLHDYGRPFEFAIRDVAQYVAVDPATYSGGGTVWPFRFRSRPGFTYLRIRLLDELKSSPHLAQLLTEQIIRAAIPTAEASSDEHAAATH